MFAAKIKNFQQSGFGQTACSYHPAVLFVFHIDVFTAAVDLEEPLTLVFVVIYAVHLSVGVGGFPVLRVVSIQVGELWQQLEHALSVVVQVCHFAVEQVQTFQIVQLFLRIKFGKDEKPLVDVLRVKSN